jgi:glycosyltransferase involved in cell wall biosynthesis
LTEAGLGHLTCPAIALFLPSLEGGGAERVFVELANEFAARRVHVDLLLASAHGPYLSEVASAVRVVDFGAAGVLQALPKLTRYMRKERPDALLSGLDHANIVAIVARVASRTRTRSVISMRSVPTAGFREVRSLRKFAVLQLIRLAYPLADAIVANSETVASDLSQLVRIRGERLHTVHNPVNISRIQRLSTEEVGHPWAQPGAPPVILGVGRLDVLKDFSTLVRAFSLVRSRQECRLVILGDGPERGKLEDIVRQLGLDRDVLLAGFVSNPFAWMRRARVFVSSSLTEGCPNALMQALACGTPVVSTDCLGGSAEILQNGKWGRLVATRDDSAMAEAIVATLQTEDYPDVRQRAKDFGHDRIVQQYLQILLPNLVGPHRLD